VKSGFVAKLPDYRANATSRCTRNHQVLLPEIASRTSSKHSGAAGGAMVAEGKAKDLPEHSHT
jgi:hypothetical protein